jgi:predicted nucleic acid-binding protein
MEITVRPFQAGFPMIASEYEALLVNFPNLTMIEIDRDVARRAAQLRAEYRLRPADALQVAACLRRGCQALITNDPQLKRVASLIDVVVLDDFAAP